MSGPLVLSHITITFPLNVTLVQQSETDAGLMLALSFLATA